MNLAEKMKKLKEAEDNTGSPGISKSSLSKMVLTKADLEYLIDKLEGDKSYDRAKKVQFQFMAVLSMNK